MNDEGGGQQDLDLIGMLHLADPLYYRELQEITENHDRVLYELIVDKDVVDEDKSGCRRLTQRMNPALDQLQLAARHGRGGQGGWVQAMGFACATLAWANGRTLLESHGSRRSGY